MRASPEDVTSQLLHVSANPWRSVIKGGKATNTLELMRAPPEDVTSQLLHVSANPWRSGGAQAAGAKAAEITAAGGDIFLRVVLGFFAARSAAERALDDPLRKSPAYEARPVGLEGVMLPTFLSNTLLSWNVDEEPLRLQTRRALAWLERNGFLATNEATKPPHEATPSINGGKHDANPSSNGGKHEAKPSTNGGKHEAKPPINGGKHDVKPSINGGKHEATPSTNGGKHEVKPSISGGTPSAHDAAASSAPATHDPTAMEDVPPSAAGGASSGGNGVDAHGGGSGG
ncbi:hypothetical protein T484DRAFT_1921478, partial [Baffinella frigidus]